MKTEVVAVKNFKNLLQRMFREASRGRHPKKHVVMAKSIRNFQKVAHEYFAVILFKVCF